MALTAGGAFNSRVKGSRDWLCRQACLLPRLKAPVKCPHAFEAAVQKYARRGERSSLDEMPTHLHRRILSPPYLAFHIRSLLGPASLLRIRPIQTTTGFWSVRWRRALK
jgi:hypothetical protein